MKGKRVDVRSNWTREEVAALYAKPLMELIRDASQLHAQRHGNRDVQVCSLISVKTGSCSEDCSYCPQSARYDTGLESHPLMNKETVVDMAKNAQAKGASRICMGAAWRKVRNNKEFDRIIEIVEEVNGLGVEVCCTLGMLTEEQAMRLKEAGLYAYNHNLDTSREHYKKIISTRTYDDRLETLGNVRKAGLKVCSGGILGLGEEVTDRVDFLHTLATLPKHPESVPINALVPVKGTPLGKQEKVSHWEIVRAIAVARILMPDSVIRLSAGRLEMSQSEQALCFVAGANSIFSGEKLLTTANPEFDEDSELFNILGLTPREAYKDSDDYIHLSQTASSSSASPSPAH